MENIQRIASTFGAVFVPLFPGKIVTWTLKNNHTSRLAWGIAVGTLS